MVTELGERALLVINTASLKYPVNMNTSSCADTHSSTHGKPDTNGDDDVLTHKHGADVYGKKLLESIVQSSNGQDKSRQTAQSCFSRAAQAPV